MRRLAMTAALIAALAAAACAPKRQAAGPTAFDKTVRADCTTVTLFTPAPISTPGADVPAEWRAFSGVWGQAGWEGKWCHDLHVMNISADGAVEVMELHAPYAEWGREATAFRRMGRIGSDGRLRLRYKDVVVEYWVENGKLYGVRRQGNAGLRIALSQLGSA